MPVGGCDKKSWIDDECKCECPASKKCDAPQKLNKDACECECPVNMLEEKKKCKLPRQ